MLKYSLDKDLNSLAIASDFNQLLFMVITRAQNERWLDKLVKAAGEFDPPDIVLQALEREFPGVTDEEGNGADLYGAQVIRGIRPFVDRKNLRAALKRMSSDNGSRVLAVEGPSLSGKSYSLYLISHISGCLSEHRVLWIDFGAYPPVAESLESIAKSLAYQIGVSPEEIPRKAKSPDARWGGNLAEWLAGLAKAHKQTCWVVFDDVSKVASVPALFDFVISVGFLADRVASELRVVLLDCQPDLLPERLSTGAEMESVRLIDIQDIKAFFQILLAEISEPGIDDLEDEVDRALSKVDELAAGWTTNAVVGKAIATVTRKLLQP
jgi:hypothetical protein